jgi:hypothetical protein
MTGNDRMCSCAAEWYIRALSVEDVATLRTKVGALSLSAVRWLSTAGVPAIHRHAVLLASSMVDHPPLRSQVEACFQAAALSTGCEVEMEWNADTAKSDYINGSHAYGMFDCWTSRVPQTRLLILHVVAVHRRQPTDRVAQVRQHGVQRPHV